MVEETPHPTAEDPSRDTLEHAQALLDETEGVALKEQQEVQERAIAADQTATENAVTTEFDAETAAKAKQLITESIPSTRQLKAEVEAMESESPVRMPGFNDRR